jgi:type VI secretion system secreted protein VgrG
MESWVFASDAIDDKAIVVTRIEVSEALGRLYEVVIDVQSTGDDDVVHGNVDDLLAAQARVVPPSGESPIWGVLRSIEELSTDATSRLAYRFVLVPRLWYAARTRRSRVFQNLNVPEIAAAVFDGHGFAADDDYVLRLSGGPYPKREYTVQYEESDLAFVSRLLEEEGITLFFEPGDEEEVVVLADDLRGMRKLDSLSQVKYQRWSGNASSAEIVSSLSRTREVVQREVVLADYDWRNPSLELLSAEAIDPNGGRGLIFTGAEHYRTPDNGRRIASIRAQEARARREVYRGKTTLSALRAGDRLGLLEHFHAEYDREYLVVEVRHRVVQSFDTTVGAAGENLGYENEIVAVPADVVWRPPRATPRPRIDGVLYATIDGPNLGAPAPIDDQGRYKVVLPFDVDAQTGGNASRWIRMAQPLSGPGFGVHFPLREGADVVLAHVQGDPDRPIIIGTVPNAVTVSPVTRANPTQSVIRTSAGIHLEFEDDA